MTDNAPTDRTLDDAVSAFLAVHDDMVFVQVGGFDGVSYDPLRPHIVSGRLKGLIVEPLPNYFEKLQALYAGSGTVKVCNVAVDHEDGERTIWRFHPAAIENRILGAPFAGISSFVMDDLLKDDGTLGGMFDAESRALLKRLIEPVPVRCRTLPGVMADHGITRVDLLQIDTEGYDLNILQMFDFERHRPSIVHFEHQHLSPTDRAEAEGMLRAMGYRIHHSVHDTLAVRGLFLPPQNAVAEPALAAASGLFDRGQAAEALAVYDYVLAVDGRNARALQLSAAALNAAGRVEEALGRLVTLADSGQPFDPTLSDGDDVVHAAVSLCNGRIAAGDVEGAMPLIEGLVTVFPDNSDFLAQAVNGNRSLNRPERVEAYAPRLLEFEPNHIVARHAMVKRCRQQGDHLGETEHRILLARTLATAGVPSSVKMENLYQALSGVLCTEPTDERLTVARELIALAGGLEVDGETLNDAYLLGFDTFYRASFDAIDLDAALSPPPPRRPWPELTFASAGGQSMTLDQVRDLATREKAEAVFLLAADEVFLERYASTSVSSILRSSDVPCLVLVFAAVPTGMLPGLGEKVGIDDRRVVFCGDGIVPSMTEYHSYNQEGSCKRPSVYYQCVRYLWQGYVLDALRLPTLVCDIDIVLQRGIRDLLAGCADADVALNRSQVAPRISDHIIANLVLVNPTEAALQFSGFLRDHLEWALRREKIPAFLDQLSLLMARLHLQRALSGRIAYFGEYDINHVIFTKSNIDHYADLAGKYRFMNLFASQDDWLPNPAAGGAALLVGADAG